MRIIGIMSGTSLDGLDIASCYFPDEAPENFRIEASVTVPYPADMADALKGIMKGKAEELAALDFRLGYFIGEKVREFMLAENLTADLIASHGHTIFHQPAAGFTCQIGNGSCIAARTGLPVVYDFRSLDVALGGQGAPLVPAGDRMLFGKYDFCLNLGGIANISYQKEGRTLAFDVCPANMALNTLARERKQEYDAGGAMAAGGKMLPSLLKKLDLLDFYKERRAKSLGKEWFDEIFFPLISNKEWTTEDRLHTVCKHISGQIAAVVKREAGHSGTVSMLVTGGGAFNSFLISCMADDLKGVAEIVVPEDIVVKYKEALIFAFLGLLRIKGRENCLASVTGASDSSIGGAAVLGRRGFS